MRPVHNSILEIRYSYPHGQCRSVGVGGYLLGGGVNWLGTYNKVQAVLITFQYIAFILDKYGYGAEHILQMRVVLADGSIAKLDKVHYQ